MSSPWLRRFHPTPDAGVRLVCLPHSGGTAGFFRPMSGSMPPGIELLAVQYPGRQDRLAHPPLTDIGELADGVLAAVRPLLDRPVALFGHSLGAVVAFEVARRLAPVHLFASGRRAPSRYRPEDLHRRDDAGLVAGLKRSGQTDPSVLADDELLSMVLPALRADLHAVETYRYRPGPALSCPVTALVGSADPATSIDDANAWAEHTTGEFDLRVFPGGHFYLDPYRPEVVATIAHALGVTPGADPQIDRDEIRRCWHGLQPVLLRQ